MPEHLKRLAEHLPSKHNLAVLGAVGAAALGATELAPNIAEAEMRPALIANTANSEILYNEPMPEKAQKLIRYNAGYIESLGCSAWVLRNEKNNVVGATFAAHCGFLPHQAERYTDKHGKKFIIIKKPIEVDIGNTYNRKAAEIDRVIAPDQYSTEMVIGAAKGHTMKEALRSLKKQTMTKKEMAENLHTGDPLYFAGKPADARRHNLRHSWVTHFKKFDKVDFTSAGSFNIDSIWAQNTSNKDGSRPGPGDSGAGVIGEIKGAGKDRFKFAGTVFGFEAYSGSEVQYQSGAFTSATAIAIDQPKLGHDAQIYRVAHSPSEIELPDKPAPSAAG